MESLIHHHRTVLYIFMKNSIDKALFVAKTELTALQAGGELVPLTHVFSWKDCFNLCALFSFRRLKHY